MSNEQIRSRVRAVVEKVLADRNGPIGDRDNLFDLGIDSIAAMMLISGLEEAFAVDLSGDDMSYEAFGSIEDITGMLAARASHGAAA